METAKGQRPNVLQVGQSGACRPASNSIHALIYKMRIVWQASNDSHMLPRQDRGVDGVQGMREWDAFRQGDDAWLDSPPAEGEPSWVERENGEGEYVMCE